jgi:hypothetical protein
VKRYLIVSVRLEEDQIGALMASYGSGRGEAVRRAITGTYRKVLREHPAIDPDVLLVDLTDDGRGVRYVVHDGSHVPSVLTQRITRRYRLAPWVQLGGAFS